MKHYGNESVDNFAPTSLVFLQDKWVENGLARPAVNRFVTIVKQAFKHGSKFGWVDPSVFFALSRVDNFKAGRTKAREYRDILPVDNETVEKTLPHLSVIVANMVQVQLLCGMRPQDIHNMRSCDIERNGEIWKYALFTHKTEHKGKSRIIAIGL